MNILVIGAHGEVGEYVIKQLGERNYTSRAVVGKENLKEDLLKQGATEVVVYDEENVSSLFQGIEAVIFLTGVSPKSGTGKTVLIDHQSVIETIKQTKRYHVNRFVMMSAVNAEEKIGDSSREIGAKEMPDELLRQADIMYTIVQPASLVAKPGTGKVKAALTLGENDLELSREDLAAVLVECLENETTYNKTFKVEAGNIPIVDALNELEDKGRGI